MTLMKVNQLTKLQGTQAIQESPVLNNQGAIADKCFVAERFLERLKGLIGKARLEPGEAMYFPRCNSVHMWFMRTAIDIIFLDRNKKVTSVHSNVRPWKFLPVSDFSAKDTLELPPGRAAEFGIRPGDQLCLS